MSGSNLKRRVSIGNEELRRKQSNGSIDMRPFESKKQSTGSSSSSFSLNNDTGTGPRIIKKAMSESWYKSKNEIITSNVIAKLKNKVKISPTNKTPSNTEPGELERIALIPNIKMYEEIIQKKRQLFNNGVLKDESLRSRAIREKARLQIFKNRISQFAIKSNFTEPLDIFEAIESNSSIMRPSFESLLMFDKKSNSKNTIFSPFESRQQLASPPTEKRGAGFETAYSILENSTVHNFDTTSNPFGNIDNEYLININGKATSQNWDENKLFDQFGNDSSSDIVLDTDASHSTWHIDSEYIGVPSDSHYFGNEARTKFFLLYKSLANKLANGNRPTSPVVFDGLVEKRTLSAQGHRNATITHLHSRPSSVNLSSFAKMPKSSTAQIKLLENSECDENEEFDNKFKGEENKELDGDATQSPRTRFIRLLLDDAKKIPPLPLIIRNDPSDDELNLAHRALGDDYIIYLSAVITDLPGLYKVNLRDNRLTDRGMGRFIRMLSKQSHITTIDLSENKIDSKSAEALTLYLKSSKCSLRVLKLSKADVDDNEAAIFMNAVEVNQSIVELDMSHNKLGGVGEKSLLHSKGSISGGAAIAKALSANTTLKSLDLSWNKLGLASATHLGNAIYNNYSLVELNLSYNRIRDEGAEAVGNALTFNTSLTSIDVSYNGIGSLGSMVLAMGLKLNKYIKVLNISGNPIGDRGCGFIIQSFNYHSIERIFKLQDCTFEEVTNGTGIDSVNLQFPTGKYNIDLSKPRNKAIMLELLQLASMKRGCSITDLVHSDFSENGKRVAPSKKFSITLSRKCNPAEIMGHSYGPWRSSKRRQRHPYTNMEADEWMRQLEKLSLHSQFGIPWIVPKSGTLSFQFKYVPRCSTPIDCLNATGLRRLLALLNTHPKEFHKVLRVCRFMTLETCQLDALLTELERAGKGKEVVEVFTSLSICIRDVSNMDLIVNNRQEIRDSIKEIQLINRSMFYICMNAFSGHYSLDLDNTLDRLAGIRLMEISADENEYIRRVMPTWNHGFTAQKQNRTNFRNERYRRIPVDRGINDDFFSFGLEDKTHGVLEFDFISIARPTDGTAPVHGSVLDELLFNRGIQNASHTPVMTLKRVKRRNNIKVGLHNDQSKEAVLNLEQSFSNVKLHPELVNTTIKNSTANKFLAISEINYVLGHFVVNLDSRLISEQFCSATDVHRFLLSKQLKSIDDLREDDINSIYNDIVRDNALFVLDNTLERFIITIAARIVNLNDRIFENVCCFKKMSDGKYEMFGSGEYSKSNVFELLGLDAENSRYEIGLTFVPSAPTITPTHRKYVINDDVCFVGPEIFIKLKCSDWSTCAIFEKAREVLAKLFTCIGVNKNVIKIIHHRICDIKHNEFPIHKFNGNAVLTHFVLHQLDLMIEGLSLDDNLMLKSYFNNGKGSSSDDLAGLVNSIWRWRPKNVSDRIIPKVDLNSFAYEFWGYKLLQLRTLVSCLWITAENAARIALEFPQFGHDAQPHRENAIVTLFSRILDIENFDLVMNTLPNYCHAAVYNRIGWLNALNPHDFDKLFTLELDVEDNRTIAIVLAKLSALEPGNNFLDPRYRRTHNDLFLPGWVLPASWTIDSEKAKTWDGVPRTGQLVVCYTSAVEHGCKPVPSLRRAILEKYFLLAVPRGNGQDYHLLDTNKFDWDDIPSIK